MRTDLVAGGAIGSSGTEGTESTVASHGDRQDSERHRGNRGHGEFAAEAETTEVSDWLRHGGNGDRRGSQPWSSPTQEWCHVLRGLCVLRVETNLRPPWALRSPCQNQSEASVVSVSVANSPCPLFPLCRSGSWRSPCEATVLSVPSVSKERRPPTGGRLNQSEPNAPSVPTTATGSTPAGSRRPRDARTSAEGPHPWRASRAPWCRTGRRSPPSCDPRGPRAS